MDKINLIEKLAAVIYDGTGQKEVVLKPILVELTANKITPLDLAPVLQHAAVFVAGKIQAPTTRTKIPAKKP